MRLLKRTYALPSETLEQFEQAVSTGKRSAVIGNLLREWLDHQRRERLRLEIVEGCREMTDVYLDIEREFHSLEEEVHLGIEEQPKKRRSRSR